MDPGEGRVAVVEVRVDGWSAKAIAGYLGIERSIRSARNAYARSAP
jgi:hypothetical protein